MGTALRSRLTHVPPFENTIRAACRLQPLIELLLFKDTLGIALNCPFFSAFLFFLFFLFCLRDSSSSTYVNVVNFSYTPCSGQPTEI